MLSLGLSLDRSALEGMFGDANIDDGVVYQILSRIGQYQVDSTQSNFIEQSTPDGVKWEDSRRASFENNLTLVDSGEFFDSFFWSVDSNGGKVDVYTDWPFARIHQEGATISAKNGDYMHFNNAAGQHVMATSVTIPARQFMGFSAKDSDNIMGIIESIVLGV